MTPTSYNVSVCVGLLYTRFSSHGSLELLGPDVVLWSRKQTNGRKHGEKQPFQRKLVLQLLHRSALVSAGTLVGRGHRAGRPVLVQRHLDTFFLENEKYLPSMIKKNTIEWSPQWTLWISVFQSTQLCSWTSWSWWCLGGFRRSSLQHHFRKM